MHRFWAVKKGSVGCLLPFLGLLLFEACRESLSSERFVIVSPRMRRPRYPKMCGAVWPGRVVVTRTTRPIVRRSSIRQEKEGEQMSKATYQHLTSIVKSSESAASAFSVLRGVPANECDEILILALIYRLAYLKSSFTKSIAQSKGFRVMLKRTQQFLEEPVVQSRTVSNVMWAMATARKEIPEFQTLLPQCMSVLRTTQDVVNEQDVANNWWATATLWTYVLHLRSELCLEDIVPKFVEQAKDLILTFTFQELNLILWACVRMKGEVPRIGTLVPDLIAELEARTLDSEGSVSMDSSSTLTAQARLVWSLSLLNSNETTLLSKISDNFVKAAPHKERRELLPFIDVICAFARLQIRNDDMLLAFADAFLRLPLNSLRDWDVSALLWSFVKLDKEGRFAELKQLLYEDVSRRGLSAARVKHSQLGYEEWDIWPWDKD